jgi:DNA-binding CsgD family transcriptional regulator
VPEHDQTGPLVLDTIGTWPPSHRWRPPDTTPYARERPPNAGVARRVVEPPTAIADGTKQAPGVGNDGAARLFVGRARELAIIAELGDRARVGDACQLVIEGPPGSGKSTLADEASALGRSRGFEVLRLAADRAHRALPYGTWRAAAPAWLGDDKTLVRPFVDAISDWSPAASAARTAQILAAGFGALRDLTFRRPTMVVFDDLHAADPASQELLLALSAGLRSERLFVLATVRERPDMDVALLEQLDRLQQAGELDRLALGALDPEELAELVTCRTGTPPHAAFVHLLHERTGGVAFFVTELLEALIEAGRLEIVDGSVALVPSAGDVVPRRVATAVLHRLFNLGRDARRVASVMSVLGTVDDRRLPLLHVLSDVSPGRTDAAFDQLVASRLVDASSGTWGFAHSLIRDAIYDDIGPATRRRMHAAAARGLARYRTSELVDVLEMAEHLRCAGGGHDPYAVDVFAEAGDRLADLDPDSAAAWYREALARTPPTDPSVGDLLLRLARALLHADQPRLAADVAAYAGDRVDAPRAGRASVIRAQAARAAGDVTGAGLLLAPTAHARAGETDSLRLHRAHNLMWAGRIDDATACLQDIQTPAGGCGVLRELVTAGLALAAGRPSDAADLIDAVLLRLHELTPPARTHARVGAAVLTAYHLDPCHAVELLGAVGTAGAAARWSKAATAVACRRRGLLRDAVIHAERASRRADESSPRDLLAAIYLPELIECHAEMEDIAAAKHWAQMIDLAPVGAPLSRLDAALAHLHAVCGDARAALELLEAAEVRERRLGRGDMVADLLARAVRTAVDAGELETARDAYQRLEALPADAGGIAATGQRLLGRALSGRDDAAAARAREHAVAHDLRLDAAHALALRGELGRDATMLAAAYVELAELGASYRQRHVAAALRELGERPPRTPRRQGELTAGQREAALLVAQGRSNREIAEAMNVSSKTVEAYLTRVYAKTGLRSRLALAVAVESGALDATAGRPAP